MSPRLLAKLLLLLACSAAASSSAPPETSALSRVAVVTTSGCQKDQLLVLSRALGNWTGCGFDVVVVGADCLDRFASPPQVTVVHGFDGVGSVPNLAWVQAYTAAALRGYDAVFYLNSDNLLRTCFPLGEALPAYPWLFVYERYDVAKDGAMHAHVAGGVDGFLFNRPAAPLMRAPYPPFLRAGPVWDNWMVVEAALSRRVLVDDRSQVVVHHLHSHDGELLRQGLGSEDSFWNTPEGAGTTFAVVNRCVLAQFQRGYSEGMGTIDLVADQRARGKIERASSAVYARESLAAACPMARLSDMEIDPAAGGGGVRLAAAGRANVPALHNWMCGMRGNAGDVLVAALDRESYYVFLAYGYRAFLWEDEKGPAALAAAFEGRGVAAPRLMDLADAPPGRWDAAIGVCR